MWLGHWMRGHEGDGIARVWIDGVGAGAGVAGVRPRAAGRRGRGPGGCAGGGAAVLAGPVAVGGEDVGPDQNAGAVNLLAGSATGPSGFEASSDSWITGWPPVSL